MYPHIRVGLEFERLNKRYRIDEMRIAHQKILCSSDDGDVMLKSPNEFRLEAADDLIKVLHKGSDGVLHPIDNNWRNKQTAKSKIEWDQRRAILTLEAKEIARGHSLIEARKAISILCVEKQWPMPCERTLRHWRAGARNHESQMSPQWHKCGNRKQGPDELLLQAMQEVVAATIDNNDRFTIAAAWKLIEPRYEQLCALRGFPIGRHARRKLRTYLGGMNWATLMKARLDGRTAKALTRTAVELHTADIFWEMVEMDAGFLPILISDENGKEIGRPVLYVGIDVSSGYPVALHLTNFRPSVLPFVDAMRFMYFPKPQGFDARYNIRHRIEVFGKPIQLKVDNGSEFIGKLAVALVTHLFGDSARCEPFTPQQKPHIERFIGIVKNFIKTLPGSLISAVHDNGRTPGPQEKLLTLEELNGRLLRFIYDDYALLPNELRSWKSRKAVAPLDIWLEMREAFLEPVPVSREEFEFSMYFKYADRTLTLSGVAYDGFTYNSPELAALYRQVGHSKVKIRYSDLDAEVIFVESPMSEPVAAFAKELQGLRVDRATAKQLADEMRAQGKELTKRTAQQRLAQLAEQQVSAKTSHGRNKEARIQALREQAEKAVRPTMPISRPPPPQSAPAAPGAPQSGSWAFADPTVVGRLRGDK